MSNPDPLDRSGANGADEPPRPVNLVLIYSLMALALIAAIGFAALIVLPFYNHR